MENLFLHLKLILFQINRAHEIQSQVFPGQPMKTKSGKELVPRSLLIQKTEELKAREEAVEVCKK